MQGFSFVNCVWPVEWQLKVIICIIWVLAIIVWRRAQKIKGKGANNILMLEKLQNVDKLSAGTKNIDWDDNQYLACFGQYIQIVFDSFNESDKEKSADETDKLENLSEEDKIAKGVYKKEDTSADDQNKGEKEVKYKKTLGVMTLGNDTSKIQEDTADLIGHLKTIYDAGCKRNRLEAQLLIQNTVSKVFAGADSLHTLISLFLVCGILGTLVGLAICISSFNIASSGNAGESIINGLNDLLKVLRGAFAPSIWGVFCTIGFIVYHTLVIQDRCINVFEDKLTKTTIKIWMPKLFPTDFQRGEIAIARLKDQVENAEEINKGATKLVNNLKQSNEAVLALEKATEQIREGMQVFKGEQVDLSSINEALTVIKQRVEESDVTAKELLGAKKELVESVSLPLVERTVEASKLIGSVCAKIEKLNHPLEKTSVEIQKMLFNITEGFKDESEELNKKNRETFEMILSRLKDLMEHQAGVNNAPVEQQLHEMNNNLKQLTVSLKNVGSSSGTNGGMGLFGKISMGVAVLLLAVGIGVQGMTFMTIRDMKVNEDKINSDISDMLTEQGKTLGDIKSIVRENSRNNGRE